MAKLWKGLRGIVKKDSKYPSNIDYSVFSKEMTLKMVFVGGHQSGKTSIVRILNKQKFSTEYDPTIGIDQHKIRLEHTETKESLWIWDISHAELGGVHEPLIFHQAHGIVLVADLTNFTNIQAIDQWLHSISVYLKRLLESQHNINDDNNIVQDILLPRLYLLISKYDLSDEAILTDTQLHKFCKSNSIRAFARISSKLDKRQEMLEIFGKFSEDIVKHLPKKYIYNNEYINEERYDYAIQRLQRNKINDKSYANNKNIKCVFDLKLHSIKTFKWMTSSQAIDDNENNSDDSDDDEPNPNKHKVEGRLLAQNKLRETEQIAKRVLVSMREAISLQKNKTMRDAREYQKTLLKLKAMNQLRQEKEYKYKNDKDNYLKNQSKIIDDVKKTKSDNSLLGHDVITSLKLDMINGLNLEIENLTQIWEDELNTIAELITFQIPLQRTTANLHRLSQQIIAREMLFKRRIRLVSELRTQNKLNIQQMDMMKQQDLEEINNTENKPQVNNNDNSNNKNNKNNNKKSSFFSSLVGKNESVEALP